MTERTQYGPIAFEIKMRLCDIPNRLQKLHGVGIYVRNKIGGHYEFHYHTRPTTYITKEVVVAKWRSGKATFYLKSENQWQF